MPHKKEASPLEYILIAALVAVGIVVATGKIGPEIKSVFDRPGDSSDSSDSSDSGDSDAEAVRPASLSSS